VQVAPTARAPAWLASDRLGRAVPRSGALIACSSVFRELLCGRCRSTADNGARNVNFNLRNAQKSRPNLIVCTDTIR
jgi:hypothetical protein